MNWEAKNYRSENKDCKPVLLWTNSCKEWNTHQEISIKNNTNLNTERKTSDVLQLNADEETSNVFHIEEKFFRVGVLFASICPSGTSNKERMLIKWSPLTFGVRILWHVQGDDNKKHSSEEDCGSEHAHDSHHLATFTGSSAVPEIRHRYQPLIDPMYRDKCE